MFLSNFFKALLEIYSKNSRTEQITSTEKATQVVLCLLSLTHHIRLLWYPGMNLANFSSFQVFWHTISYTSADYLLAQLGLLKYFWIFSVFIVNFYPICITASLLLLYFNRPVPKILKIFVKWGGVLTSQLLFVPITVVQVLVIKYSTGSYVYIDEYPGDLNADLLNFGMVGWIFSVFSLFFHIISNVVHENAKYEIDHYSTQFDIGCKITCEFDILYNTLSFISCISFVNLGQKSYTWYLFLAICFHFFNFTKFLYYLPYYSSFMNELKVLRSGHLSVVALFFLLGWIRNDAMITFVLFTFTQIPLIFLILSLHRYRVTQLDSSVSKSTSFFIYELLIRPHLCSGSNPDLVSDMNKAYKLIPNKLLLVIQANYCKDILGTPMIGLVKISRANHNSLNLLTSYQVFKCKEILQKLAETESDSYKLFTFSLNLLKTKQMDLEFCESLLKVTIKLLDPQFSFTDLKKLVNHTYKYSSKLRKQYGKVLKKMPESDSVLEMYASLLSDILNKSEKGKKFFSKRSNMPETRTRNRTKSNFNMQDNSCIIIVSGESKNIGKILWANKNFLTFAEVTEENIKESYLSHFVPQPFQVNHDIKLMYFIEHSTCHHVFRNSPLFLLSFQGFLVECYFNSDCIGYQGQLYFLSIIEPILNKKRECAIISESGLIFSHSQNFPKAVGSFDKFVKGRFLREYIKSLEFVQFEANFLYSEDHFALVVKEKIIGSSKFLAVYITEDLATIKNWKSRKNKDILQEFEEKRHNSLFNQAVLSIDKEENNDKIGEDLENVDFESKKKAMSSDSTFLKNMINAKLLQSAIRALKIMKYLLLASVVTILVYNTIMLVYISQTADKVGSLDILMLLGDISYSLSQIGLVARSLWIQYMFKVEFVNKPIDLENLANDIAALNDELLNRKSDWSFCSYSKVISENNIPYWEYSDIPQVNYGSLYLILDKLVTESRKFLIKLNSTNEDLKPELFFIINNAIGQTFQTAKKAMNEMKNCNIDRVLTLNNTRINLMIVAITISALLGTVLTFYLICNDKVLNELWTRMRFKARNSFYDYRRMICERISLIHDQSPSNEDIPTKSNEKFAIRHSWQYFLRFFLIFLLTTMVYVISSFAFYSKIHSILYYQPIFLTVAIERRIMLNDFSFLVCEEKVFYTDWSLSALFPEFSIQDFPEREFPQKYSDFLALRNLLQSSEISNLMTENLRGQIFESLQNVSTFLSLGTNTAINFILQESFYLLNPNQLQIMEVTKYLVQIKELCDKLKGISAQIFSDSKVLLKDQVSYFTLFVITFNILIFFTFLVFYRPYINKEIRTLLNLSKLIGYFPEKATISHDLSFK